MSSRTRAIAREKMIVAEQAEHAAILEANRLLVEVNRRLAGNNAMLHSALDTARKQNNLPHFVPTFTAEDTQERRRRVEKERRQAQVITARDARSSARRNQTKIAQVQREANERQNMTTNIRAGDIVLYKGSEMVVQTVSPVGAILILTNAARGHMSIPATQVTFLRKREKGIT